MQGIDALNRVTLDAAAHTIRTRSPISLPLIAPVTEDEDLKNLENLRQIISVFNKSRTSSRVGTVAGMTGDSGSTRSSTNLQTTTQVVLPQIKVAVSHVLLLLYEDYFYMLHALYVPCHISYVM